MAWLRGAGPSLSRTYAALAATASAETAEEAALLWRPLPSAPLFDAPRWVREYEDVLEGFVRSEQGQGRGAR